MGKRILIFTIIFIHTKIAFSQRYFQIEGTKRIFIFYKKLKNDQLNDSTTLSFYVKKSSFYIKAKIVNRPQSAFVEYIISNTRQTKITSVGRGDENPPTIRFINVSLLKAKKPNFASQYIEYLLKEKQ